MSREKEQNGRGVFSSSNIRQDDDNSMNVVYSSSLRRRWNRGKGTPIDNRAQGERSGRGRKDNGLAHLAEEKTDATKNGQDERVEMTYEQIVSSLEFIRTNDKQRYDNEKVKNYICRL